MPHGCTHFRYGAARVYSLYKLAAPRKVFIWPPFFEYNKRLLVLRQKTGGACLYMPQDGLWLASFEVIPPPQKVSFLAAKKMKISHWKLFSWSIFFLIFLAFYNLCGENFVTPFSTLAMIQGSLPTNSTTPDRLRCRARPSDEDFTVFWRGKASKKSFFLRPASSPDLHPKRSP